MLPLQTDEERAEKFRRAREELNQHGRESILKVAAVTNIPSSLISDLENSLKSRQASYVTVAQLAMHYGVSVDFLCGLTKSAALDHDFRRVCEYTELSDQALRNLTENDWWFEYINPDGTTRTTETGIPIRVPHSGLQPADILSKLLEDPEFMRVLGTLSRNTAPNVRKDLAEYDATRAPCEDESDGIRTNPIMVPFGDTARELIVQICTRHFENAIERLLENHAKGHPLQKPE